MWGFGTFSFETESTLLLLDRVKGAGLGVPLESVWVRCAGCSVICVWLKAVEEQITRKELLCHRHSPCWVLSADYLKTQNPEWMQHLFLPILPFIFFRAAFGLQQN